MQLERFQSHIRNQDVLKTSNKEKLYNRPRGEKLHLKILLPWHNWSFLRQIEGTRTVLPPLDGRPGALGAAACLAGALGAGEELGHELRDVWKLGVGVQHVHGLLHFLQ